MVIVVVVGLLSPGLAGYRIEDGCAPAIAADGTVYAGSANLLYAFGD